MTSLTLRVEDRCSELATTSTPELLLRLQSAISVTVEKLLEIAAIVRVLEDRGEDLDSLKMGMIDWFRRIAYGQCLPEVFERYRYKPRLLEAVAALPIPDQSKLSAPCSLPVLVLSAGEVSERQVDPVDMTAREIRQVFGKGRLRNLTEQRGWLEDHRQSRISVQVELESGVVVDKKKRCLVINGFRVSRSQLLGYLSHLDD